MSWLYQRAAHGFMRNPNVESTIFKRHYTRKTPFENTLTVLNDPVSGKKVYLIGTTNSSTPLAERTRQLIEEVKPQSLFVQTSKKWFERAEVLDVTRQEHFNRINPKFNDLLFEKIWAYKNNPRGLYFKLKITSWMLFMNFLLSFPDTFNPWRPGIEMLWAIQAAQKTGSKVSFLGGMFNSYTVQALNTENNANFLKLYFSVLRGESFVRWRSEARDFFETGRVNDGAAFGEAMDNETASWFVSFFERLHPEMKRILVNYENERIFQELTHDTNKVIVALVNHWHVPGISTHWRSWSGTEEHLDPINPIGDMPIDEVQEANAVNDMLRAFYSKQTKTEPAAWTNYFTHYHKSVMEPERERHVFYGGVDDHHLDHAIFNEENKEVSYLKKDHGDTSGHHHTDSTQQHHSGERATTQNTADPVNKQRDH